jgi:hypothetical protein
MVGCAGSACCYVDRGYAINHVVYGPLLIPGRTHSPHVSGPITCLGDPLYRID